MNQTIANNRRMEIGGKAFITPFTAWALLMKGSRKKG